MSRSASAIELLSRVVEQSWYAQNRGHAVLGGTRATLGEGYPDGDRIALDASMAIECLQRARSAADRAIAELRAVDIDAGSGESA